MSLEKFFNAIFFEGDSVWINNSVKGCPISKSLDDIICSYYDNEACSDEGFYFVIHAAKDKGLKRSSENTIEEYSNFILEFDDISLDEQKKLVEKLKVPYTSAVYSGGKSIHYIISLEEPVNYETYLSYFTIIQELTLCDPANKDKTRYSRLPNAYRGDVLQELIDLRDKIPNQKFYDWLESGEVKKVRLLNSYEKRRKQKERKNTKGNGDREGIIELLEWYSSEYLGIQTNDDIFHIQCPVCANEGHDRSCDNLSITLPDYTYRCWRNPEEHDRRLLPTIQKLKEPKKQRGTKW